MVNQFLEGQNKMMILQPPRNNDKKLTKNAMFEAMKQVFCDVNLQLSQKSEKYRVETSFGEIVDGNPLDLLNRNFKEVYDYEKKIEEY